MRQPRFHSSVRANHRQEAVKGTRLGARAEARRLSAADPCPRWTGAPIHDEMAPTGRSATLALSKNLLASKATRSWRP